MSSPSPTGADAGPLKAAIARIAAGNDLGAEAMAEAIGVIMDGGATAAQIGGLLMALRMKGETADELAGAAAAMRARATPLSVPAPERAVDTCGTGGDGSGTVNVSTLAAIIAAGAGALVVKHGNRAQSSRSGSADVLEQLGVAVDAAPAIVEACLGRAGIGFAFAPTFHAATRHAGPARRELGTRTIFNLLGPLTNPGRVAHQVVGVFDKRWCGPMARALGALGARRAFVVHGDGGIDELAVRGATWVAEWTGGGVKEYAIVPGDFRLPVSDPRELAGADPTWNAGALLRVLSGADARDAAAPTRAVRHAALMAAGLALVAMGAAADPAEGAALAAAALDDGRALRALERWIAVSQGKTP
ncbi:MAG TPA: anthranilate phosphoribosyltransferase [Kofleriaceae bacterium]|nr:anthranilate phosphoribosyltransferase [Kofleriaceae bacterium]